MGFFFTYKDFHLKYSSLERRKSIYCHFLFQPTLVSTTSFYLVNQISFWGVLEIQFLSCLVSSLLFKPFGSVLYNLHPFYHTQVGSLDGYFLFEHDHVHKRSADPSGLHHEKLVNEPGVCVI